MPTSSRSVRTASQNRRATQARKFPFGDDDVGQITLELGERSYAVAYHSHAMADLLQRDPHR
jgi:hypothetical protein